MTSLLVGMSPVVGEFGRFDRSALSVYTSYMGDVKPPTAARPRPTPTPCLCAALRQASRAVARNYDASCAGPASDPHSTPCSGSSRLRNPAGQGGGLLHPVRHLRLVELVAFVDVEVP